MDARSLLALANLNKHDRYQTDRAKLQTAKKEDWRWVGYDSTIGMGIVQSGNLTRMGKVITNGYLVEGQPVEFNQDGQFGTIEGMQYVKPQPRVKKSYALGEDLSPTIVILFEAYKDGSPTLKLYAGGLSAEPVEITPVTGGENLLNLTYSYEVDNLGESQYDIYYDSALLDFGIVGKASIVDTDYKISPPTSLSDPAYRAQISTYVGSGIFVASDIRYFQTIGNNPIIGYPPFHIAGIGAGGATVGQSGTATWLNGVRFLSDSATIRHQVVNSSYFLVQTNNPIISGAGSYVLPDGSLVAVFGNCDGTTAQFLDANTLFAESAAKFVYKTIAGDYGGSVTHSYYYRTNGATIKVAERVVTPAGGVTVISGTPEEIERAYGLRGRLTKDTIYSVLNDRFAFSAAVPSLPSTPFTGSYTVEEISLLSQTFSTSVYQVFPIPPNYVIPNYFTGSPRVWNASFNFKA